MISLGFMFLYLLVISLIYILFEPNTVFIEIISVFIGFIYAVKIEPWIYGIHFDIKKLNEYNKNITGHYIFTVIMFISFPFVILLTGLTRLRNYMIKNVASEVISILTDSVFSMIFIIIVLISLILIYTYLRKICDKYMKNK